MLLTYVTQSAQADSVKLFGQNNLVPSFADSYGKFGLKQTYYPKTTIPT